MAVFLADRVPAPRKLFWFWFGIGLSAMFGLRVLVPAEEPPTRRSMVGCRNTTPVKPARFIGIGADISDYSDAMGSAARATFAEALDGAWTIAPHRGPRGSSALDRDPTSGFFVSPRLAWIDSVVERDPNLDDTDATFVTCKVELAIATYPSRYTIATVEAQARVTAASHSDPAELAIARSACVTSAVEDAALQAAPAIRNIAR